MCREFPMLTAYRHTPSQNFTSDTPTKSLFDRLNSNTVETQVSSTGNYVDAYEVTKRYTCEANRFA